MFEEHILGAVRSLRLPNFLVLRAPSALENLY